MKTKPLLAILITLAAMPALAQDTSAQDTSAQAANADALPNFFLSMANNHPWFATALLIIGGLRVLFKPVMTILDSYVKTNCSTEEYAKLQSFEAGPVYKWLSFGLDFLGSVKLPVIGVKPSAPK